MNYNLQIEKYLNKLLGKNNCMCQEEDMWSEDHWYYELFDHGDEWRNRYVCTECFVRDNLILLAHKCIVGKVHVKTVVRTIIKVHNYIISPLSVDFKELDNLQIIAFSNFLSTAKESAKKKKELEKIKQKYKKYVKQKKAKRRKLWLLKKKRIFNFGGTD